MNFRTTLFCSSSSPAGPRPIWYRDALAARLGYAHPADATPDTLYILRRIRPDAITRIEVTTTATPSN